MSKPQLSPEKESDQIWRRINDFATRSFRDMADGDYIAARLAFRAGLMPQGLWSAQQSFEKYLKYILLVNRIPATNVGHDIARALQLLDGVPHEPNLSDKSQKFFDHVAAYGPERYLSTSYFVKGRVLCDLDCVVWEMRRYCQILDVFGKKLPLEEQKWLKQAREQLKNIANVPPNKFRLSGGLLEKILDNKKHPARSALIWQNPFFGSRARTVVKVRNQMEFSNAPLYLFPDMLEELLKYVHLPKHLVDGYRSHLEDLIKDPTKRP